MHMCSLDERLGSPLLSSGPSLAQHYSQVTSGGLALLTGFTRGYTGLVGRSGEPEAGLYKNEEARLATLRVKVHPQWTRASAPLLSPSLAQHYGRVCLGELDLQGYHECLGAHWTSPAPLRPSSHRRSPSTTVTFVWENSSTGLIPATVGRSKGRDTEGQRCRR